MKRPIRIKKVTDPSLSDHPNRSATRTSAKSEGTDHFRATPCAACDAFEKARRDRQPGFSAGLWIFVPCEQLPGTEPAAERRLGPLRSEDRTDLSKALQETAQGCVRAVPDCASGRFHPSLAPASVTAWTSWMAI
jgi:hypothetical protein